MLDCVGVAVSLTLHVELGFELNKAYGSAGLYREPPRPTHEEALVLVAIAFSPGWRHATNRHRHVHASYTYVHTHTHADSLTLP